MEKVNRKPILKYCYVSSLNIYLLRFKKRDPCIKGQYLWCETILNWEKRNLEIFIYIVKRRRRRSKKKKRERERMWLLSLKKLNSREKINVTFDRRNGNHKELAQHFLGHSWMDSMHLEVWFSFLFYYYIYHVIFSSLWLI